MTWHYASNGERRGPVSEEEFQGLVQQGVINRDTLVWREGMSDWAAYDGRIAGSTAIFAGPLIACAGCGRQTPQVDSVEIAGFPYCVTCKPRALHRLMGGVDDFNTPADQIRNLHIKHEASVKSVGLLYYLGGFFLLLAGAAAVAGNLATGQKPESVVVGALFAVLAAGQLFAGSGLRRLRPWARIAAGVLSGIGLIGFPLGTIINGYILWLLFSQKGTTVFSPEYQEVIRQTPHIKYKTSIVVWVVLGLLVLFLFGIVLAYLTNVTVKH